VAATQAMRGAELPEVKIKDKKRHAKLMRKRGKLKVINKEGIVRTRVVRLGASVALAIVEEGRRRKRSDHGWVKCRGEGTEGKSGDGSIRRW